MLPDAVACPSALRSPVAPARSTSSNGHGSLSHSRSSFQGFRLPKVGLAFSVKNPRCHRYPFVVASRRNFLLASQPTLYDLLELAPDVASSDIKHAYRQMARKYHPDVCQSEESTRRFIEIQEAYETLSDPRRRAIYDTAVARGMGTGVPGRTPWNMADKDVQPSDWKSQWEDQLSGLKRRSAMKAQKAESWASRVRRQTDRVSET